MANIKFENGRVYTDPPKKPKKITGTRFGAVLNVNKWQTPFQAWCEITKVWVKPYEDTIYTQAGKVIEEKQLSWFERLVPIVRPEDVYGKDFFDKTFGDFFPENHIFGGMWDSLVGTIDNQEGVIECKTTKRAEDWEEDIPEYYALQAALYARLKHLDDVYMIVTFLDEKDYEHPEDFVCNSDNTTYMHFKVSERYPDFDSYVEYCTVFWHENIMGGISPVYDEKKDKEYLAGLKTGIIESTDEIDELIKEAEVLYAKIKSAEDSVKEEKKRLKAIEESFKKYAIEHEFNNGQDKSLLKGSSMTWTVSKTVKKELDVDLMKDKGVYEEYLKDTESYAIRKSMNKESEEE